MLSTLYNVLSLPMGLVRYRLSGHTPPSAHLGMISLFCWSSGRSNDLASRFIELTRPPIALPDAQGVLGNLEGAALDDAVAAMRERGYLVFPRALSPERCDRLMQFALETEANVRRMDDEPQSTGPRMMRFDRDRPEGVRYDYPVPALLDNDEVQGLLADHSLLALSQAYLGAAPRADVLSMWWHTKFGTRPDSEAAQFFHFDLDRPKWLKVFVYLTDVGAADGPHTFIAGSHKSGEIPLRILRRGYARLSDEEVLAQYGRERWIELAAPRGTVIVEDTRGLHKGKAVTGSPRLVLQLQFSNSLFGATYAKSRIANVRAPALADMIERAPDVYRAFL